MILFFQTSDKQHVYAVQTTAKLTENDVKKLEWLFGEAVLLNKISIEGNFIGPRRELISPWSTTAVEITQNIGITGISRIEEYRPAQSFSSSAERIGDWFDPMLQRRYENLDQEIFTVDKQPDPIILIDDIAVYNQQEALALSDDEIAYLNDVSKKIGRKLTDSEVFGFSQVNSEHCRHKIFNGRFIIDGEEKENSLFAMIKKTSATNPNKLVSAYKDNVSFNEGPEIEQFAPASAENPDYFERKNFKSAISMKAETHNFPTTVEPFNGGSTGSGGEIRDRLGGGKAALPLAGMAVYMTAKLRNNVFSRKWLYQTPEQILIKASNGAGDFGNKYGQPLICGSLLTFEHVENDKKYGYDKVIMQAGGVGYGKLSDSLKGTPEPGQKIVVMGGDNYRIGMGGGAGSSVDIGHFDSAAELNSIQRANPDMQKRVANVIRSLAESNENPIVSIHDHGAGGHLNCLSELVEAAGGKIDMSQLPIGDPSLSAKEIIGNESQERMGLLVKEKDLTHIQKLAERERAPMYVVGNITGDMQLVFEQKNGERPIDMNLSDFFGNTPKTILEDTTIKENFSPVKTQESKINEYIEQVLQLEAVACKDWLTNKADRSITGKVAQQQCAGEIQLPLNDCGVVALDYRGESGVATSIGHAPMVALINPANGSILAIAEALTNIVWAPMADGLSSISLSANWMWPCKNAGEDARLYKAVEACSEFACELGINIPTGKDSLSMTQKYGDEKVFSPGTVIITAAAEVSDVKKTVSPVLVNDAETSIFHIDFSFDNHKLGGSALAQTLNKLGDEAPTVKYPEYFREAFNTVQTLVKKGLILAGHDISAGGLLTALLEMCFGNVHGGLEVNIDAIEEDDLVKILFAENPGVLIQVRDKNAVQAILEENSIGYAIIAQPCEERHVIVTKAGISYQFGIDYLRDLWFNTSYLLDKKQSGNICAAARFENYKQQPLQFCFDKSFTGKMQQYGITPDRIGKSGIKAAVIREQGTNGEREMAYAMYLAGFDVKDVHTTDLISGRETLEDVNFIVFCGSFSYSEVFGSAKGWVGDFIYNEKAKAALEKFYARKDTLSLGISDGCRLMVELNLLNPEHDIRSGILPNDSRKFESNFIGLTIPNNNSVLFGSLSGSKLGVWVAHNEGKFHLPKAEKDYNIIAKYTYSDYPANPNGSDYGVAGICSADGRHLAMMPHLERSIFPWQWAHYPAERKHSDQVTPWIEAFVNAREWVEKNK